MGNSISLALYLATRARSDPASKKVLRKGETTDTALEDERLGQIATPRPENGALIWFHTGSDHQARAVRELANRMKSEREELNFLLTTSEDHRLETDGCHIFQLAPHDTLPTVRRFLDHWSPDIAIWTEPDLRPALITAAADDGIPLFMIDARTAAADPQPWRWLPGITGALLSRFQRVLTGNAETATALKRLGADPDVMETLGYLEEGTPALTCNEADRDALAGILAARPVWLAARTTVEECAIAVQAHSRAQRRSHRLLLILALDDPQHGPALAKELTDAGHRVALRSKGEEPEPEIEIFIADTEGELGLWYRLAAISFLGKSFGSGNGVNPYEPAALGSAIIHGPNISGFENAFRRLGAARAARLVLTTEELSEAVEQLLSPDVAATMAHEAWKICSSGAEVTDRVRDLIFTELDTRETV